MAKCLENFVSQALGLFTRFYAAELRIPANALLVLSTREDIIKTITNQVFQQLEAERSTIELLRKTKNKLGLDIDQELIDKAIPYLKCRHIFVHSDGKPDAEFKSAYPTIELDSKGRIKLSTDFLNIAYNSVNDLLKAYDSEMIDKHYLSLTECVG